MSDETPILQKCDCNNGLYKSVKVGEKTICPCCASNISLDTYRLLLSHPTPKLMNRHGDWREIKKDD